MLCYAVLCCAMLCYAVLCFCAMPCHAAPCHAVLCHAEPCWAQLHGAVLHSTRSRDSRGQSNRRMGALAAPTARGTRKLWCVYLIVSLYKSLHKGSRRGCIKRVCCHVEDILLPLLHPVQAHRLEYRSLKQKSNYSYVCCPPTHCS